MGNYCPKCGATVTGHYPVCVVCDAVLGDPASVAPIAPWVPPSQLGNPTRTRVILAALVLAVIAIPCGIWRASRAPGNQDAASMPIPERKAVSIGAAGLGVDIYPGAKQNDHAAQNTPHNSATTATFTTSDALDKVVDFYEARLGSPVSRNEQSAVFAARSDDRKTGLMLTISEEPIGQTKIAFLHSTTR